MDGDPNRWWKLLADAHEPAIPLVSDPFGDMPGE